MQIWSTDDVLKYSSVIVHCKVQGEPTVTPSPDAAFRKKHQTSILTEVKRDFPDLQDSETMERYYDAREARMRNDIPKMLQLTQEIAEKYWPYWPNTLWLAYGLRVFGQGTYPQAEAVFNAAEENIEDQLSGKLPMEAVPTSEPVTETHLKPLLSMMLNNHAEFYRVQSQFDEAIVKMDDSIKYTDSQEALSRRLLAKAGILAQMNNMKSARECIEQAKKAHAQEWSRQLEHVSRHYPGLVQAIKEVN